MNAAFGDSQPCLLSVFPTGSLDLGTLGFLSISQGLEECPVRSRLLADKCWLEVTSWLSVDHVGWGLGGGGWLLGDLSPVL